MLSDQILILQFMREVVAKSYIRVFCRTLNDLTRNSSSLSDSRLTSLICINIELYPAECSLVESVVTPFSTFFNCKERAGTNYLT